MKYGPEAINSTSRGTWGDTYKLAASIALHGLSLTVPGIVVRTPALVASGRTWSAGEASAETTAAYKASSSGYDSSTAGSERWSTLKSRIRTGALSES